jgi:hypothetical protein
MQILIIHFPIGSQLEHSAPFGVSVITHILRHTVGLLWTNDQPFAETSLLTQDNTTYRHKRQNIHAYTGIRTRDSSNQAAADLRLRPRGHWDLQILIIMAKIMTLCGYQKETPEK